MLCTWCRATEALSFAWSKLFNCVIDMFPPSDQNTPVLSLNKNTYQLQPIAFSQGAQGKIAYGTPRTKKTIAVSL